MGNGVSWSSTLEFRNDKFVHRNFMKETKFGRDGNLETVRFGELLKAIYALKELSVCGLNRASGHHLLRLLVCVLDFCSLRLIAKQAQVCFYKRHWPK